MFRQISNLVRRAYGDDLLPVERWALNNAHKCSADEIIAASVVRSLSNDFDSWRGTLSLKKPKGAINDPPDEVLLIHLSGALVPIKATEE